MRLTFNRATVARVLSSTRGRDALTVWSIVFMMSGQGFRYMLGVPFYIALCLLTLGAVVVGFRDTLTSIKVPFLISAFIVLSTLSIVWSATSAVSVVAVTAMIATTFLAAVTVQAAGTFRFMRLLYRGLQVSLLGGLAFELVVSVFVRNSLMPLSGDFGELAGISSSSSPFVWSENLLFEGGPIQGFVGNRNPFGAIALSAGIVAMVMFLDGRVRRIDALSTIAFAMLVTGLTRSATAFAIIASLAILVAAAFATRRLDAQLSRLVTIGVGLIGLFALLVATKFRETVLGLFDRGTDLTNRTGIWDYVSHLAMARPQGWGFVGSWPVWEDPYASIAKHTTVRATHAHNAYLDAWLQLGIAGLVCLVAIVIFLAVRSWRLVHHGTRGDSYIPLGWALLTATLALQAFTESRLLVEGGWFLLVALVLMVPGGVAMSARQPFFVRTGTTSETDLRLWRKIPTGSPSIGFPAAADGDATAADGDATEPRLRGDGAPDAL